MLKLLALLCSLTLLASCASTNLDQEEATFRQIRTLSNKVKQKEREIEKLKVRNEILRGNIVSPVTRTRNLQKLVRLDLDNLTEQGAYGKILGFYKAGDELNLKRASKKFLKKYPKSSLNDNIYYLIGSIKVKSKEYVKALKFFDRVVQKYGDSDKAPHAIYAKGLVYKKLGLDSQAKRSFSLVVEKFSQTDVARKAVEELKLFK